MIMNIYYKQSDITASLSELMLSPWALECNSTRAMGIQEALHLIQDMINGEVPETMKIPAADVKPNIKGYWIKTGQSFIYPDKFICYSCSECGYDIEKIKFNYCPNCGAKMECKEGKE